MPPRTIPQMIGCLAVAIAAADEKPKGYQNLTGSGFLFDKVEYMTYAELVHPLKKKLEKGKMDEMDFQVEEKMVPKGGILAVEAKTRNEDPVIEILVKSGGTQVAKCDESTSKPGLTMKHTGFNNKYTMVQDENNPVMTFECPFRTALPDSFSVELVTDAGKVKAYSFKRTN